MRLVRMSRDLITDALAGSQPFPKPAARRTAVAVGSFDGLHRGHLSLISAVQSARERLGLEQGCLFTFRHHPRLVLDSDRPPRLLTSWTEKLALLRDSGIDLVVAADFCPALARLEPADFVRRFLLEFLGMRHLVGGHDVGLGRDRRGDAAALAALGEELGFGFETVPALREGDAVVSSTTIRRLLDAGAVDRASVLLGRPFATWGEVGFGAGRGAALGYPTANITPLDPDKILPAPGVYAVRVLVPADAVRGAGRPTVIRRVAASLPEVDRHGQLLGSLDQEWAVCRGMLNFGRAPTVHGDGLAAPRIEVHIFDFAGYIRERSVKVEWVRRLREEREFPSLAALQAQLARDEARARELLDEA